jgi:hypothetical protein
VKGEDPIAAVAFAQIRADKMGFQGVVGEEDLLPGLPANRKGLLQDATNEWPAVLDEWSGVIGNLATRFHNGEAEVDPRKGVKTCTDVYCDLQHLCRIGERSLKATNNDGGDA